MINEQKNQEDSSLQLILILALLALLCGLLYWSNQDLIHASLAKLTILELLPFSWMERPAKAIALLESQELPLDILLAILKLAGQYFRFLVIPLIALFLLFLWKKEKVSRYMFKMSAQKLIAENARHLPCLRPIAELNLLAEPYDSGPWAVAKQPTQWAVEQKVLTLSDGSSPEKLIFRSNGTCREDSPCLYKDKGTGLSKYRLNFAADRALTLFQAQLGGKLSAQWEPFERGLIAAFLAFGHGDKKMGQALLDHMSSSFKGNTVPNMIDVPDTQTQAIMKAYWEQEEVQILRLRHGIYMNTLLPALLVFARNKGVVACSQFIWLKPLNRPLWYALNQVGGRTAWVEAAGPWAHSLYEDVMGVAVDATECEGTVQGAVDALQHVLELEGWLPPVLTREAMPTVNPIKTSRENLQRTR